jgi:hypothetical protein
MIDDFESPTVIRTRVLVNVQLTTSPTGNSFAGFGIYVASGDEDDATVPTLLWDPMGDHQSDWIYRHVFPIPASTPSGTQYAQLGADTIVESLAKRKVPRGSGILAVFGSDIVGAGSSATFNAAADVRVLLISG